MATAQNNAQYDHPLEIDMSAVLARSMVSNNPPLDAKTFPRTNHSHKILHAIIAELLPVVPDSVRSALENLDKASESELEEMATALLSEQFEKVPADKSMFVWAALSVYLVLLAVLL
ncbi:formate dehydrogenase accessory protein FdhE [Providencia stuartii]|uniref:formate dehydrogenase accessory protein FdhE domain-containing protein n=1 Tax=Providencia stuartii TaxID=588 RepID=UPI0024B1DD91